MSNIIAKLKETSNVRFIVILALLAFVVKVPGGILGTIFVSLFDLTDLQYSAFIQEPTFSGEDMFLAIVFAPFLETLMSQMIPIEMILRTIKGRYLAIIGSAFVFMLMHYPVLEFFPSAFLVGMVFAWAWVVKRDLGLKKAFIIVTLIHSLHNALVAASAALLF